MFDKNAYLTEKIINKLTQSENFDESIKQSVIDLMNHVNVDVVTSSSIDENNVITLHWVKFCTLINELLESGMDVNIENFKDLFQKSQLKNTKQTVNNSKHEVSEKILNKEEAPNEDTINRLLSIAEEVDMIDSFNLSLLNENGLRVSGFIKSDETSLDGEELNVQGSEIPYIIVDKDDVFLSPFTSTANIYQLDSDTWLDLETDQTFKVYYSS